MGSDLRIRRDRSALSNGAIFGRRRRGVDPWKLIAWFFALGFLGLLLLQKDRIEPQVAALIGSNATATPPAIDYAVAADRAFWRGDLTTAVTNYREAVRQQPQNIDFMYELARMIIYNAYDKRGAAQQDDWNEALTISSKAIEVNPNNAQAYTINCFALYTLGRSEDAVRACVRAIDLNAKEANAYAYLASAYSDLTRFDAALEAG